MKKFLDSIRKLEVIPAAAWYATTQIAVPGFKGFWKYGMLPLLGLIELVLEKIVFAIGVFFLVPLSWVIGRKKVMKFLDSLDVFFSKPSKLLVTGFLIPIMAVVIICSLLMQILATPRELKVTSISPNAESSAESSFEIPSDEEEEEDDDDTYPSEYSDDDISLLIFAVQNEMGINAQDSLDSIKLINSRDVDSLWYNDIEDSNYNICALCIVKCIVNQKNNFGLSSIRETLSSSSQWGNMIKKAE